MTINIPISCHHLSCEFCSENVVMQFDLVKSRGQLVAEKRRKSERAKLRRKKDEALPMRVQLSIAGKRQDEIERQKSAVECKIAELKAGEATQQSKLEQLIRLVSLTSSTKLNMKRRKMFCC